MRARGMPGRAFLPRPRMRHMAACIAPRIWRAIGGCSCSPRREASGSICSRDLHLTEEFYCCAECESPAHRLCWIEAGERSSRCGGRMPRDPLVAPVTPWLDVAVGVGG